MYAILFAVGLTCFKLLLIPSYFSTDFEVHRNWLAVTYSLPIKKWYYDDKSPWTLDYPPLFAWFECLLAQFAVWFDPQMLVVENLNYVSDMTVLFQRLSVIVTDAVYLLGCHQCATEIARLLNKKELHLPMFVLLFGNVGLLLVDHIHFQYNGFLYGILFLSIARVCQGKNLEAAFYFAVLLNLKHIYLYIAPAFFVFLLRSHCFSSSEKNVALWRLFSPVNFSKLAFVVMLVFTVSFGPFVVMGQMPQVLKRLFPFKRGLSHAYWAPNFWALYNFADKIMTFLFVKSGLMTAKTTASMTGGLVQEFDHSVLPSIHPAFTVALTFLTLLPSLLILWRNPGDKLYFIRAVILCAFSSFLFGWHVHEKAILMVILPLGLLCFVEKSTAAAFMVLSVVGNFSLFPLIFTPEELPIKVVSLLLYAVYAHTTLGSHWENARRKTGKIPTAHRRILGICDLVYLLGLIPLFLYAEIFHTWIGLAKTFPFLPLMLMSIYCCLGVLVSWLRLTYSTLTPGVKLKTD